MSTTQPLQQITNKIIKEAKEKADRILKKAKEEYQTAIEKTMKKLEEEKKREIEKKAAEYRQISERKIAEAKVYSKRMLLDKKEELIEEAFKKAYEKLKQIKTTPQYINFLKDAIRDASEKIGGGEIMVYTPDEEQVKKINLNEISAEIMKKTGTKTTITLAGRYDDSTGGVIVQKKDGTLTINNTFETLIENAKNYLRSKVANILFS